MRNGGWSPCFLGDIVLKAEWAGQCGNRCGRSVLLVCLLALGMGVGRNGWSQKSGWSGFSSAVKADDSAATSSQEASSGIAMDSLAQWSGLPVRSIAFEGVAVSRLAPLPSHLAQAEGKPLNPENLKKSLRQLYATGLFETIEVEGSREADGVA